ncbi:MAG: hypothetical protein GQ532_15875 [Methylomarinum sp.]|nr:hypothetical protein [Methylomarinum sp.]
MEIHSSSLAFIPAGYKGNNKNNESSALPKEKEILVAPQKTSRVDNNFKSEDVKLLSDNIEKQEKNSTNTLTARALNAYIQENTQPLKDQRTNLVSGIDFFA